MSLKITYCFVLFAFIACGQQKPTEQTSVFKEMNTYNAPNMLSNIDTAVFAAGCFWCSEAQFSKLNGVIDVTSGFSGGTTINPTYKEVCTGKTGHAEVVEIIYDTKVISYDELLAAFFTAHDPTQLNRQGNDIGTQYRSAIFPKNDWQKERAAYYINRLNEEQVYDNKVVTTIEPFIAFYPAEDYHDDYYANNPQNPYCQMVVKPKVEHFERVFKDKINK